MAPDGLSHKFGITQGEHPVEIVRTPQRSCWRSRHGICQRQVADRRAQAGAAYQVSMHLVAVLAALHGNRSARAVPYRVGALNFSGALIKRSAHVVQAPLRRSEHLILSDAQAKSSDRAG